MKHKIQFFITFLFILISSSSMYSQTIPDDSLYFGQYPPGDSAIIFAPGRISLAGRTENRITFSHDRKMCFFSAMGGPTYYIEYKNEGWTAPYTENSKFISEPFFSLDGKRVYINSRDALNMVGSCDLSYSEKKDSSWSDPVSLGNPPNLPEEQYHPCIVADSSIYFSSGAGDICRSQYLNGAYQKRVVLPYPINYANTSQTWGDPYVAPDESYLIFRSTRIGGYGGNDIYISYKKADGSWTNPKNLGNKINTDGDELSGDITPDGKYMTFGRNGDIYWVSANFIDSLKHTNFIPYLKNQIINRNDTVGHSYSFTFPDSTFIDDDGNNTLTYSATLNDGSPLPSWLIFQPSARTFSGTPTAVATLTIKVTATDTANASTSCQFNITVVGNPTDIRKNKGQLPKDSQLLQNYPDPFNPTTTIHYSLSKSSFVKLTIYNLLGQKIRTFQSAFQNAGEYSVVWDARDEGNTPVSSGIYFYRFETEGYDLLKKMILIK